MKKLILLLVFTPTILLSQANKLGIGVVHFGSPTGTLVFYRDTLKKVIIHSIEFSERGNHYGILEKNEWLNPVQSVYFVGGGYLVNLDITCLKASGNWFKVLCNPTTNESYRIYQNNQMSFAAWNEFLMSKVGVRRKDKRSKIYKVDNINSDTVSLKAFELLRVLEVKGYWMKVGIHKISTETIIDGEVIPLGWIKWRNDNSLLIHYFDS